MFKDHVTIDLGSRVLIYPLNSCFIGNLDPSLNDKWIRAGWNVDKTVLLELDYMTIPAFRPPEGTPASNLFSGVIHAWNAGKYFKFVAFTRGYFENIDEVNMKIDCWHEGRHVRSSEQYMCEGSEPLTEDEVAKEEVIYVCNIFGEAGLKKRRDHVFTSIERNKNTDAILGYVAIAWLREFFEDKINNYRSHAVPIPQNNCATMMKEMNRQMTDYVAGFYQIALHISPKSIFKHSLR